jgi:hypothetical protein
MSRGVLIFAHNNSSIDYVEIAIFAAERVKKFLNVPVSLVTDNREYIEKTHAESAKVFDRIIDATTKSDQRRQFNDGAMASNILSWKNFTRSDCYDITPYDETLVIDADFIINSDHLNKVWDSPHDFLIYKNSYDLAQWRDTSAFDNLNGTSIPFYWATVFYFKKTEFTNTLFTLIQYIRANWSYYRLLYALDSEMFRNDFAFSMALHIMNDSSNNYIDVIPGKLYYTLDRDLLIDATDNAMTFLVEKEKHNGEYTALKTKNLDIHVMNKYSISRYVNEQ